MRRDRNSPDGGQSPADHGDEIEKIAQAIRHDVFDDIQVDVNEDIAEPDHVAKGRGHLRSDPAVTLQQVEE